METNVGKEIAALQRLTVKQLRQKYVALFGEETPAHNQTWLVRCIAWRLQVLAEGGLSAIALRRATELADDADLWMNPPVHKRGHMSWRVPPPGEALGSCVVASHR